MSESHGTIQDNPFITNTPRPDDAPGSRDRNQPISPRRIQIGDIVVKTTGDYIFMGEVCCEVIKRSGEVRYVVEDSRGLLMIMASHVLTVVKAHDS
jgi:hypothetical protein